MLSCQLAVWMPENISKFLYSYLSSCFVLLVRGFKAGFTKLWLPAAWDCICSYEWHVAQYVWYQCSLSPPALLLSDEQCCLGLASSFSPCVV